MIRIDTFYDLNICYYLINLYWQHLLTNSEVQSDKHDFS